MFQVSLKNNVILKPQRFHQVLIFAADIADEIDFNSAAQLGVTLKYVFESSQNRTRISPSIESPCVRNAHAKRHLLSFRRFHVEVRGIISL